MANAVLCCGPMCSGHCVAVLRVSAVRQVACLLPWQGGQAWKLFKTIFCRRGFKCILHSLDLLFQLTKVCCRVSLDGISWVFCVCFFHLLQEQLISICSVVVLLSHTLFATAGAFMISWDEFLVRCLKKSVRCHHLLSQLCAVTSCYVTTAMSPAVVSQLCAVTSCCVTTVCCHQLLCHNCALSPAVVSQLCAVTSCCVTTVCCHQLLCHNCFTLTIITYLTAKVSVYCWTQTTNSHDHNQEPVQADSLITKLCAL
jgi:hypothetical protein